MLTVIQPGRKFGAVLKNVKKHSSCSSLPRDSPLPTRVIEVSPPGQDRPRVFESNGARGVYATLSYARGKKTFPTLNTSNYAKFTDGLDMNDLPPTIRDAVLTARILSIPYLWIDAFCVLQDVEEERLKEISRMNNIYGRSALTIVAVSTESVYDGLFYPRIHNERLHTIPVRFGPGNFGSMSVNELDAATYDELFEPISKRAWTAQEQVMSNRLLTFTTNTMIWSLNLFSLAISEDEACTNKDKALSCWLWLVSSFSLGTTSLENDKLNALAGVASRPSFSHTLGPEYYAGLWQYELARQLTWSTSRSHRTLAEDETFHFYRPENYRAPSWSWASVEGGKVNFDFYYDEDEAPRKVLCDILECSTLPAHPKLNPFGEVSSAHLRLQGPARLAWFNPITSNVFILPESTSLASTALDMGDSVITFEEALQKHTDEFVKAHPDEDIAEEPELLNGTYLCNVEGICDETRLHEPVLVLAVGITLAKGLDDGVRGLLLVKNDKNYGGGMFQRIGVFERGKTMDFENGQKMKVSII
ncbi:hypothetical protein N7528_008547 [Penicillium herquei]|nr:hypothetical protein N7528_008547 [Penicillium herquei]